MQAEIVRLQGVVRAAENPNITKEQINLLLVDTTKESHHEKSLKKLQHNVKKT